METALPADTIPLECLRNHYQAEVSLTLLLKYAVSEREMLGPHRLCEPADRYKRVNYNLSKI